MQAKCGKDMILTNTRKVCGQVQGVEKMIEQDRDIADILQQITASSSALKSVARMLLMDYANGCFNKKSKIEKKDLRKLIDQLIKSM